MSIDAGAIPQAKASSLLGQFPAWLWLGIGVYALLLVGGTRLLSDSDTYWQIAVGQWILDHHVLPRVTSIPSPGPASRGRRPHGSRRCCLPGVIASPAGPGPSYSHQPASLRLLHCLHGSSGGA